MSRQKIVLVEDDAAIRQGVLDALEFEGFEVIEAAEGRSGLNLAIGAQCDLILLDLMLPGVSGLDILQQVRVTRPTLPVIILTAKGDEADRVKGLKLGADDYVVKPFSVKELLARVHAVLRRSAERPTDVTQARLDGKTIDLNRREIRLKDGKRHELSEREAELLRYLLCNPSRVISRDEILANVWRIDPHGGETRTIDMHVARLREKLGDSAESPAIIVTVRGKGYMLQKDPSDS